MKEWTREERYRTILEASNEELTELRDIVNSCPYRQKVSYSAYNRIIK